MHIGLFSPALPSTGAANGIVTYVRFMQAALRDLGHRVTVIAHQSVERPNGEIELVKGSRWVETKIRGIAWRLGIDRQGLVSRHADIRRVIGAVHNEDPFDIFEMEESFGWVGNLGLNVPVVGRLHGPHFLGKDEAEPYTVACESEARIAAEGRAIAAVTGITSPSPRLLAATLDHYAMEPKHAAAIYNPTPVASIEQCWSIERCDPDQLLFIGRFDLRKGADIVLEAFTLAAERNPLLRLVMCGPDTGIVHPSGERVHFSQYLAQHVPPEYHDRISYLGEIAPAAIEKLRLESAICLSTSRFETFGYSMTEALALGMPLISSDTFGIAELLRHGETGYIVPVGDASIVAATITEALSNRTALAAVGAAGRALCAEVLNPRKIAEDTINFYRSLQCELAFAQRLP